MVCRFYIPKSGNAEGECSLGSSSVAPLCSGGNDETKCGLAISVIAEFVRSVKE